MSRNYIIVILLTFGTIINAAGQEIDWVNTSGWMNADNGNYIVTDKDGNIYCTGYFSGNVDFDPGPNTLTLSAGSRSEIFVTKYSSQGQLIWAKKMGGNTGYDRGYSITLDSAKNVYVTGTFTYTGDFDPGSGNHNLSSSGEEDIFISKLDSNGNFVWAKEIGGTDSDVGNDIVIDKFGNILITGRFEGSVDFNPGSGTYSLTASGSTEAFILKLDPAGNFLWALKLGYRTPDDGVAINTDLNGNILATGTFTGTVQLSHTGGTYKISSVGDLDIYVLKLDQKGILVWLKTIGGSNTDMVGAIVPDNSGNVLFTGHFQNTCDFDPGPNTYNLISIATPSYRHNTYIAKLDSNGAFKWAKLLKCDGGGTASDLRISADGIIYSAGSFSGNIDFDPGTDSFKVYSAITTGYILQLDSVGGFVDVRSFEASSSGNILVNSINIDSTNNINLTGRFNDSPDFDPSIDTLQKTSSGSSDIFISRFTNCDHIYTSISDTVCDSFAAPGGQVLTNSGTYNIRVPKADGCDSVFTIDIVVLHSTYDTIETTACDSFIAPDGRVYRSSGNYTAVIPNAAGCDSIISVKLTVHYTEADTIYPTACDSFIAPDGKVYFESGLYTAIIPSKKGCDSVIALDLTVDYSTDTSISVMACDSFTAPDGQTYFSTGTYSAVIPSHAGCDSTISILLTVNHTETSELNITVCDSFQAPDNKIYRNSGTYISTIPGTNGCDSVITINLSVKKSSVSSLRVTACDSFIAPDGQVYYTSGIYKAVIPNSKGCDSIITLDLAINESQASLVNISTCDSFAAPNGEIYSESGVYTSVLQSSKGCDSIVTYDVMITVVDTSVSQDGITLTSNVSGAQYQWLDCNASYAVIAGQTNRSFTASENGSYAVSVTQNNCTDTSACYLINTYGVSEMQPIFNYSIYPNPAGNLITVELERLQDLQISICDVSGKAVYQSQLKKKISRHDVSEFGSGIYFITLRTNDRVIVEKLVIHK